MRLPRLMTGGIELVGRVTGAVCEVRETAAAWLYGFSSRKRCLHTTLTTHATPHSTIHNTDRTKVSLEFRVIKVCAKVSFRRIINTEHGKNTDDILIRLTEIKN